MKQIPKKSKQLKLQKNVITNLNKQEMETIKGGNEPSWHISFSGISYNTDTGGAVSGWTYI
ncbi:TIGR04149 family rSAM-modified RiPP [Flavobacterium sp. Arc3]|uniref:TIGR04149 family rSAM-modified RiPP n=1 Tax=Flavobacterium sp. Arc3 TaxID=3046686 RepID=UPI00352C0E2D